MLRAVAEEHPHDAASANTAANTILVQLTNLFATVETRKRIEERVRALNRKFEESGTSFRLRLL